MKPRPIIAALIGSSLLTLFIVLMVYSFDVVPYLCFGVLYDSSTKQLTSKTNFIYTSGRYFVGPGQHFLTFPSRRLTLTFSASSAQEFPADFTSDSIQGRSRDGLQIKLELYAQIQLIDFEQFANQSAKANLELVFLQTMRCLDLFNIHSNFLEIIASILASCALDALSGFMSNEILSKRNLINQNLAILFQNSMNAFGISVPVLVLSGLTFVSQDVVNAIEQTQILNENVQEMGILENSILLQLNYTQSINSFDNLNAVNSAITRAQINTMNANGTAIGVNQAYQNLIAGITKMQPLVSSDFNTFNFLIYLAIFKNTFSANQTILLTNAGFF